MQVDTEAEVIALLLEPFGFWDDDNVWRYDNDEPDNFDLAGNQQSNPEAGAGVE